MSDTIQIIIGGSVMIAGFVAAALIKKEKSEGVSQFLFWGIAAPIIFVTLFLVFDTVGKNLGSVTGGPVHWHADYKILSCLEEGGAVQGARLAHAELEAVDPEGLANRVGSPLLHEHNDNRIHIEGTVSDLSQVTLAKFFETLGGQLSENQLVLPTNEGLIRLENGSPCGSGEAGTLQVFLYKTHGDLVKQEKLEDFTNYVISPFATVPPGDCLIFEFTAEEKEKTDKICDFYQIAIEQGKLKVIEN